VHVECPDDRCTLCERRKYLADFGIRFFVIPLSIFFAVPEAETEDAIRLSVGGEDGLIHKAFLRFQNRQDFLMDGVGEFTGFPGFGIDFDYSSKHRTLLSWG